MRPWLRYVLLEIPDLLVLGVLLWLAHQWDWIEAKPAWLILGLWIVKDALLFPLIVPVLARKPVLGPELLVGQTALVVRDLDPEGTVKIRGELWRAESASGPIVSGTYTEVLSMTGLTLRVRRRPDDSTGNA